MNYSLTFAGIIVSVGGSLLLQLGFSEACANEIIALAPVLLGGVMAYIGRLKAGGVSVLGFKG